MIKIIEAPRDAMQGIHPFIPTRQKAKLINDLLKVGFHTIDFGSFVSPHAIPQLKDTAQVLPMLDLSATSSRLMAIVGNERGGQLAASWDEIDLGTRTLQTGKHPGDHGRCCRSDDIRQGDDRSTFRRVSHARPKLRKNRKSLFLRKPNHRFEKQSVFLYIGGKTD